MGSSLGSLVVRLGLDSADYTSGLTKAEAQAAKFADTTQQSFKTITRSANETSKALDYLKDSFKVVAAAFGLRELSKLSDEYQNVSARLKIVTASSDEFVRVQGQLLAISNETRTSFGTTANLFYRISQAALDLGTSQKDVIQLTEGLNKALIVSGASGSTAKGALEQLAQALGANQLRGQEFNTVNEQGNRIIRALGDGLGKTAGELRQLANDGEITTEVFIRGFLAGAKKLDEEFTKVPITISGALQVAENNLQSFVGSVNSGSGATGIFAKTVLVLSNHIDALATAALTFGAVKLANILSNVAAKGYENVSSLVAQAAAQRAHAAVSIESAQAELVRLAATEATIVAARAQAIAELAATNALIAKGAVSHSFANVAIADLARLGAAQAGVTASTVAAQNALKVAQVEAAAGVGLLGRALGFLGGPIGAVITILGAAVAAWQLFGSSAEDANAKAARSTEASTKDILLALQKQNDRLTERLALARQGNIELAKDATPAGARAAQLHQQAGALRDTNNIDRLNDTTAGLERVKVATDRWLDSEGAVTAELDRQARIDANDPGTVEEQAAKKEAEARALAEEIRRGTLAATELEAILSRKTVGQLLAENANKAEKLATALAEAKKQLGLQPNQEFSQFGAAGSQDRADAIKLEQRIREKFAEKDKVDDPTKKTVDGQIKAIEAQIAREKDILRAQEDFLKDTYHEGYLSVKDYYDRLQTARDDNLTSTLRNYDDQIAAFENLKKEQTKQTDKQDTQNKIDDVNSKRVNALRDAGFQEQALNRERIRSTEEYKATLGEVNAKILELTGNTAAAAAIRFDEQNKQLERTLKAASGLDKINVDLSRPQIKNADGTFSTEKTITVEMDQKFFLIPTIVDGIERGTEEAVRLFVEGLNNAVGVFKTASEAEAAAVQRSAFIGKINDPNTDEGKAARALKQNQELRAQAVIQGELNDKAKEYAITLGYVDLAVSAINSNRAAGNIGELTALAQTSEANRAKLEVLKAEADAYALIAERSKDPADLLKAKQLQEAVRVLGLQVDLVADKFNNIFGTAFSDQLTAFITGAKTLKQAVKDFGKDVNAQIVKGIADEFKAKLFGQDGALAGIGKKLSELFGFGGKDAAGAGGKAAELLQTQALATARITLTSSEEAAILVIASMTSAASAAAAALAAVAASSAGGSLAGLGGLFGSVGTQAGGAVFNPGSPYQGPGFGYAAAGTSFAFGGPTWVGEHGMELVNLPRGSQVVPSDQVGSWMKGRGSGDTHVHISQIISGQQSGASLRQTRNAARDGVMAAIRDR